MALTGSPLLMLSTPGMKEDLFKTLSTRLTGKEPEFVWFDEFRTIPKLTVDRKMFAVEKVETPGMPEATIHIFEEDLPAEHPRNPNPKAKVVHYVLECGNRRIKSGPYLSLPAARLKAQALHKEMVDGIDRVRAEKNLEEALKYSGDDFGRF